MNFITINIPAYNDEKTILNVITESKNVVSELVKDYEIKEIPVNWINLLTSRARLFRDGPKMLIDLVKIRWCHGGKKFE